MTRRILIAGCGDLGTELGLRLAAQGWEVFGARRSPEVLPPQITGIRSDLEGDLGDLPPGLDVVVHAAAAGGRDVPGYEAVYRDGLRRLLQRLFDEGQDLQRAVLVSATSVYGVTDGSEVDEDTPTEPSSGTGQVLVQAEQLLRTGPYPGTAVRLAGIYGPGRTRLIDTVRDGSARQPRGDHPTNRIHRDDAAAAIVHLLTEVGEPAPVYVGVDRDQAQLAEVQRFLAAELGVPEPPLADPDEAGSGSDARRGDGRGGDGRRGDTRPSGARRSGAKRCRSDRLLATGFALRYPTYREGYRSVLAGEGVRHR